jgi:glycosyltransferase involved in cell wall biosynthesis
MKIVIAAVSSTANLSGVTRHAANVSRCLLTRPDVSAVHVIVAPWQHSSLCEAIARNDSRLHVHSVPVGSTMVARNLWYYRDLPSIAAQLNADVVHLSYPAPLNADAFSCPTIVSLHDLYPYDIPENFGFPKVLFHRLVLWQCLRAADVIACVSESTRQGLSKRATPSVFKKAVTIFNCVEPVPYMSAQSPLSYSNDAPFFLCVAQHRRNKNIVLTMSIFRRLLRTESIHPATRLVIVGVAGPETSRIHRFVNKYALRERVAFLSGIADAEMQWLYENCQMLLAPSIVEGFGLPVAEGLLAGCRIVCSDIPAFRELGESGRCRYVRLGPSEEEAFIDAVCSVLHEPRRMHASLPQLSAPAIADEYMQLYRKSLLSRSASSHSGSIPRAAIQKGGVS